MVTIRNGALFVALATLFAACGSNPGSDSGSGPQATPKDPSSMKREAKNVGTGIEMGAKAYRGSAGSAFAAGCPTVSAVGTDADGDGVTSYTTMQYSSCAMATAYGSAIVNGDEALVDNNDGANDFNISHAIDLQIAVQDTAGTAVHYQAANNGSHDASGWKFGEATDVMISSADASGSFTEHDEIALSKIYEPASSWAPGQPLVTGTYVVSGAYQITIDNAAGSSVTEFALSTVVPLTFDPSCPTLIVAGQINAAFNDANGATTAEITWTGCDANGVELVPTP